MKTYALSHQGHYRSANEDAYLVQDELGLYVVADGIGSMQESSIASDLIVQPFHFADSRRSFADLFQSVKWEILRRHYFLYEQSQKYGNSTGATLATLLLNQQQAGIVWAGDSRIYGCQPKTNFFMQLTEDDVCGRAITRAVGVEADLQLNQKIFKLQGGERFLLCSDGLYKKVSDSEIHFILKHESPMRACQKLVNLALQRAVRDNITVMIVEHDDVS